MHSTFLDTPVSVLPLDQHRGEWPGQLVKLCSQDSHQQVQLQSGTLTCLRQLVPGLFAGSVCPSASRGQGWEQLLQGQQQQMPRPSLQQAALYMVVVGS